MPKENFKVGDKIVWAISSNSHLTKGKVYPVKSVYMDGFSVEACDQGNDCHCTQNQGYWSYKCADLVKEPEITAEEASRAAIFPPKDDLKKFLGL